jgi:hypothetical protein
MTRLLTTLLCVAAAGCAPRGGAHDAAPAPLVPLADAAFADAAARTELLAPGVAHTVVTDARGPWTIHVVEVDRQACRPLFASRKPGGTLAAGATTSSLAAGTLATINADFFRVPGATPVGAHVARGVPWIGPTEWPVFAVSQHGEWAIGRARLDGMVRVATDSAALTQVNRPALPFTAYPAAADGVELFTARADTVPTDSLVWRVMLRPLTGDEGSGSGVVVSVDSVPAVTVTDATRFTLLARGTARAWARRRAAGDTVAWRARVLVPAVVAGDSIMAHEAVGGFPELLRHGRDVLGEQAVRAPFGEQRHPRTAIGWSADGARLFLVVVDGRQPPYSDGMSLPELVWVFRRLGAAHALNLDGGGSTALVINSRLVSRPSDTDGERVVGNALSLLRCGR